MQKPELIKEGSSLQELIDGMELSFIGVYRNGDISFDICYSSDIYVDDLHLIVKADGTKELHYREEDHYGADGEHCEILPDTGEAPFPS